MAKLGPPFEPISWPSQSGMSFLGKKCFDIQHVSAVRREPHIIAELNMSQNFPENSSCSCGWQFSKQCAQCTLYSVIQRIKTHALKSFQTIHQDFLRIEYDSHICSYEEFSTPLLWWRRCFSRDQCSLSWHHVLLRISFLDDSRRKEILD